MLKMILQINSTLLAIPIISIHKAEAIFYNKDTTIKCNTLNNNLHTVFNYLIAKKSLAPDHVSL